MCDHNCKCSAHPVASQSLDEMDFERGIWYAAQYGDLERVRKLANERRCADEKDSAGYTALHYAARNGHLTVCLFLLDNGADVNAVTKGGATALCRAATAGKEDVVDLLLSKKADPFIQDSDGKTALHRATENKHFEICKRLLNVAPSLCEVADNRGNKAAVRN
ncbi:ankyrin repeat domain-containing protein 39 [Diabrotica virgifera virgifera]|uniref:Ankyrin repeat domain-containing protein 39 n=1 Tax=Diabrotica virgifera virgifera TaxID=50390 RepID=A0A6P7GRK1_DIAVI|nr:ankyrin repeat domain-containing protein 39 [Diabrotica virgifera virgifera]XP_028146436.1 ankyrin repeat domain-containing protein 39 [Diabrotica virgifera virgifera]XP_050503307.1 ankyrin repeat domain-containing protein 39 [Diabrotica virgifera virgifera]